MPTYRDKAIDIGREDLPGIYYSASEASIAAQRMFLLLIKINTGLLLLLAVLSAINITSIPKDYQYLIPLTSAVLMIISIIITYATEAGKYEKKWYDGRAIAESLKTLSWKFMMKAEPFYELSKDEAEAKFLTDFKEIKTAIRPTGEIFGGNTQANEHQLTDKMKEVYASDLETRKGTYEKNRIGDQKKWYSRNSGLNGTKSGRFFWIIIGLQIFTVLAAFFMISMPSSAFNATGLVTTAIATLMTWVQVKQYRNLAESYGVTSTELSLIEDTIPNITKNKEFSGFVAESETAISREHTLWRARRTIQ
jgi:hypothetical protein